MGRRAQPGERVPAVEEDVVRVDAVEPSLGGEARQIRLREDADAVQASQERRPLRGREVERAVDVEVGDPE